MVMEAGSPGIQKQMVKPESLKSMEERYEQTLQKLADVIKVTYKKHPLFNKKNTALALAFNYSTYFWTSCYFLLLYRMRRPDDEATSLFFFFNFRCWDHHDLRQHMCFLFFNPGARIHTIKNFHMNYKTALYFNETSVLGVLIRDVCVCVWDPFRWCTVRFVISCSVIFNCIFITGLHCFWKRKN